MPPSPPFPKTVWPVAALVDEQTVPEDTTASEDAGPFSPVTLEMLDKAETADAPDPTNDTVVAKTVKAVTAGKKHRTPGTDPRKNAKRPKLAMKKLLLLLMVMKNS